jgi:hypothetical protein
MVQKSYVLQLPRATLVAQTLYRPSGFREDPRGFSETHWPIQSGKGLVEGQEDVGH